MTNYRKPLGIINFFKIPSRYLVVLLLFLAGVGTIQLRAQVQKQPVRILFLFDASQSMLGKWNTNRKIDVATRLLQGMVDSLKRQPHVELALRCYGHQSRWPPQDCEDTRLEIPFGKGNHEQIKSFLGTLEPRGTTPIAYSLEKAGGDFPKGTNARNVIVLITDGKEECNGDPCAISAALQEKGITLKPFIIGIGLDNSIKTDMECIGKFYDASTEESFADILKVVITQILNPTTAQVNLLDINGKATESNVPFTLYDMNTGSMIYNWVHTFNDAGFPDTLYLDNNITYKLKVHTIPSVEKSNISITHGKHNIISVSAPQGSLNLKVAGTNQYGNLKCIVRQSGKHNTLHVMDFGYSEEFLVGEYDLEILSTPRILLNKVKVSQSMATTVEIEEPGLLNLQMGSPGYGAIYKLNGKDMEFVCTVNESASQLALVMQPGSYKVVFRYRTVNETVLTKEKNFTITSGSSTVVSTKF